MNNAIKKTYEWLYKKAFIIFNGEKLLKEREEQEVIIAQFQNDIIKLRKKIKKLEEEKNNVK